MATLQEYPRCAKCDSKRFTLCEYLWHMTREPGVPEVCTKFWCCRDCGFTAGEDTPTVERLPECPKCASPLRYQVVGIDDADPSIPEEGKLVWGLRCHACSFQAIENDDLG